MNRSQTEKTLGGPAVFGRPRPLARGAWFWRRAEKHLWCSSCFRTFPNGVHRRVENRKKCPYADCDGDFSLGMHDWSAVRRLYPAYPVDPWMAVRYPASPGQLLPAGT